MITANKGLFLVSLGILLIVFQFVLPAQAMTDVEARTVKLNDKETVTLTPVKFPKAKNYFKRLVLPATLAEPPLPTPMWDLIPSL